MTAGIVPFSVAAERAIETITTIVPGEVRSLEVMTADEQDRRLAEPPFPPLASESEIADMLGVAHQDVAELRQRHEFPAPVQELAAGPVWRADDPSRFAEAWQLAPERPKASGSAERNLRHRGSG